MYNINSTSDFRGLRKGSWTDDEDELLRKCVEKFGEGNWHRVPQRAGLNRCRKSCRLRWMNYLKPNIKRGKFSEDEIDLILRLHKLLGNRWALIAGRIPGRTANDVKNYWNSHLLKKFSSSRTPRHGKTLCKDNDSIHIDSLEAPSITKTQIIKPQPRTFLRTTNSLPKMPHKTILTNGPTNGPVNRTYENPKHCNSSQEVEEEDLDTSWLDNFLLEVEEEDMLLKGACNNMKHYSGPGLVPTTGPGLGPRMDTVHGCEGPSNQGELTWLSSSLNEMHPQTKATLWEEDHFWNFDISLWE